MVGETSTYPTTCMFYLFLRKVLFIKQQRSASENKATSETSRITESIEIIKNEPQIIEKEDEINLIMVFEKWHPVSINRFCG